MQKNLAYQIWSLAKNPTAGVYLEQQICSRNAELGISAAENLIRSDGDLFSTRGEAVFRYLVPPRSVNRDG